MFPMVGLGLSAADNNDTAAVYIRSAWGPNMPVATQCNPCPAYAQLFGSVAAGSARQDFDARSNILDFMNDDVQRVRKRLAGSEREKFEHDVNAFDLMSSRQRKLAAMASALRKHAPERSENYTSPNDKE